MLSRQCTGQNWCSAISSTGLRYIRAEALLLPRRFASISETDDACESGHLFTGEAMVARSGEDIPPCRTLYVRNLCEKTRKEKLRKLLHDLFSPYGQVTWISASKTIRMRGQAFITLEDVNSATNAMHKLQGINFLNKPMQVQYAKQISDRAESDRAAARNKRRSVASEDLMQVEQQQQQQQPVVEQQMLPPNRILFVENIPKDTSHELLADRFARFAGYVEVRSIPGKEGIAFVEFNSEADAAVAMSGMNAHVLVENEPPISVTYAKQ